MKKLVTLLCALVLCLSVFSAASACGKYPDDYIASRTGNDIMRTVGEEGHQLAIEFAEVCTICGRLHGFSYAYLGKLMPHESEGQRYYQHIPPRHFYSQCTVCNALFNKTAALVPPDADPTPRMISKASPLRQLPILPRLTPGLFYPP